MMNISIKEKSAFYWVSFSKFTKIVRIEQNMAANH